MNAVINSRGSEWHRWDPHIHAPGTILNNQFGGEDPWGSYLSALEQLTPKIEAIGITDYYLTDGYEKVRQFKAEGRLKNIGLVFPNIELRLDVAAKTGFVNIHLLVSPEDPNHISEVGRILKRLQFYAHNDRFDCTRDELIKLGRQADPSVVDDVAALQLGATRFKVNFDQLRKVVRESEWATKNILIAVAGGAGDGTSGLRQAADTTVRQEIEKFAHIIFASSHAQREFWLGQRPGVSLEELSTRYDGCKPCLHGSDSHDHKSVGQPAEERYCWVKGALEFDSLRQACIDPAGRAYVGEHPPGTALPSQVIASVKLNGANWACTTELPLNPGLVAIVGARGSGKTALADVIAAGCDAIPEETWNEAGNRSPSFLTRARPLVRNATTTLIWGSGATVSRRLDGADSDGNTSFARARYLSQQFVEELCSSNGVSDGLVQEIERVIFESHSAEDQNGAIDFSEFKAQQTERFRLARDRESGALTVLSDRIATEIEKETLVPGLQLQVAQKKKVLEGYVADQAKLVVKGTETLAARHIQLGQVAQNVRDKIQQLVTRQRAFVAMQDEVTSMRATGAPEMLRQAQARHVHAGFSAAEWEEFLLIYKGNVDRSLSECLRSVEIQVVNLTGNAPPSGDPNVPLVPENCDLSKLPLAPLTAEMARLESLLSADRLVRQQYAALTQRIARERSAIKALELRLEDALGAASRRKTLQNERNDTYQKIFDALISEQTALGRMYEPLMARLAESSGTLSRLAFTVRRIADVDSWGAFAEEQLLDRRKAGAFNGRGSLTAVAVQELKEVWETGTASEIMRAITAFADKYRKELFAHAPVPRTQEADFRQWLKEFAKWLFSAEHITVRYEVSYDGIDIQKLSPGTRGIVLLLLYLALDDADDRPLIIDQPEENLDPKSVFEELVPLFLRAKTRRQVIMVTHNANLVINTDADQIIVASSGPSANGELPPITYIAGGLETQFIRTAVCEILEGGEMAFKERARRLRVRLER